MDCLVDAHLRSQSNSKSWDCYTLHGSEERVPGVEMAQPPPQAYPARGCAYNIPIGVETWADVLGFLNAHNQAAHPVQVPAQPAAPAQGGGDRGAMGKLDKRPRPQATTDMSEHDFKFFENE